MIRIKTSEDVDKWFSSQRESNHSLVYAVGIDGMYEVVDIFTKS